LIVDANGQLIALPRSHGHAEISLSIGMHADRFSRFRAVEIRYLYESVWNSISVGIDNGTGD
jgi:hypothetical protein